MKPQFLRAIFVILMVRAIFSSPAQASEFVSKHHLGKPTLKRLVAIRPSRLRFTKSCSPSASLERIDCLDGSDDDERTSLSDRLSDGLTWVIPLTMPTTFRPTSGEGMTGLLVRLRC